MKKFAKAPAIYAEITQMEKAEKFRREDRMTVSNFFNGAPPLTDEEAEELGLTVNVNHLFGYRELSDTRDQILALYTKPLHLFEVQIGACKPGRRIDWELEAKTQASRVLRKIKSFKTAYEGAAGDAGLHGEGVFFFPNTSFPLPRQAPLSKLLVPDDSTTDTSELPYFAIEGNISLDELRWYYKRQSENWKGAALGKILAHKYENCVPAGSNLDPTNVEEAEHKRQENSGAESHTLTKIAVYYFYQKRGDLFGCPWDLTILVKKQAHGVPNFDENADGVLYEGESLYPNVAQCLHPFFMDCILGGEPKWHRVMGLGTLNYALNQSVELLICRAKQGTYEASMNLWEARDSTTREALQQIVARHNGIVPEGISMVQNRYTPNLNGILEMVQFYRQQSSKNARGVTPNNGDQNDQLEVQAMWEQNMAGNSSGNRAANWYDYKDGLWTEVWRRLTDTSIDSREPGYSEVMDFQNAMMRLDPEIMRYLQPDNCQIRAVRLVGDGIRQKELGVVQFLSTNRQQYAPEVQPKITRLCTALALDNYRMAEELSPIAPEPDETQKDRAETENAKMIAQRLKIGPRVDDVDELHIVFHFPALERLIMDAVNYQKGAFMPIQTEAFQIIGGHIMAHIMRIEGKASNTLRDPNRERAKQYKEQLNEMATIGEKLADAGGKQQEGQQTEMSAADMAKLRLEMEKLELQREKLTFAVDKFQRTQGFREQNRSFDEVMKLEQNRREGMRHDQDSALADTKMALEIANTGKNGNSTE